MKNRFVFLVVLVIASMVSELVTAQKFASLDKSPLDVVYFKSNGEKTMPLVKVVYSRPQKKGRTMIGGNEPFGKIWRTGANETTEIKFYKDVILGGDAIKAGTYSLYTIPGMDKWTIIINSKLDTWGAYEYEVGKDIARFDVPVRKAKNEVEAFSIAFDRKEGKSMMYLAWELIEISIPISFM